MLSIKDIEEEITKLEHSNVTTYPICEKLAILYMVKDHFKPQPDDRQEPAAAAKI